MLEKELAQLIEERVLGILGVLLSGLIELEAYGRCGCLMNSRRVFLMRRFGKDVVVWCNLICEIV